MLRASTWVLEPRDVFFNQKLAYLFSQRAGDSELVGVVAPAIRITRARTSPLALGLFL